MTHKIIQIGLCTFLWALSFYTIAESMPIGDPKAGFEKSKVCAACHAAEGNSTVPAWPKITDQSTKYFIEQMKDFRKGDKGPRFNPVMFGLSAGLSDQDIADLAAFFASQKTTPGITKAEFVSLGERIYRGGNLKTGVPACSGCHDPQGMGNSPAGFPRLSGQHPEYIIEQLKQFRSGARINSVNGIMTDISKRMTDEEIQAVSNYVSGLH